MTVSSETLHLLVSGNHSDPHAVLGAHPGPDGTVVRTLRRGADAVSVLDADDVRHPMRAVHPDIFEVTLPDPPGDYRLVVVDDFGTRVVDDPYRWLPSIGDLDLHLIAEGRHERLWTVLGAVPRQYDTPRGPVTGVSFAVWAPNAKAVRLVGDFIGWGPDDGWPMRSLGGSGVWEIFVPEAGSGVHYRYRIQGPDGVWRDKADPLATATDVPPKTASRVYESRYQWHDGDWMGGRPQRRWYAEPMSAYEVHLGSWRPGLSYRDLATQLVEYVVEMGFTHVELLPVAEHPYGGSWGYQVTSYYAPTARFGEPDDFRYLVDALHRAGIGVILDWVPAHFPRDDWALARFDGTPLYEHPDPHRGEQPDWGTYVFHYGRPEVRNFLVANALYWLEEFHIDGLRVDAVASMLYLDYSREPGQWQPNEHGGRENLEAVAFLRETNTLAYATHPGTMLIAEESTAWPGVSHRVEDGGLGFGFKWNMGWMHDTLGYFAQDPLHRQHHHNQLTFALTYAWSENFVLPISHDEVVHGKGSLFGKMPGDSWRKLANVRALLGYMWAHPGKQLLFSGCEYAQPSEWSEERGLVWSTLEDPAHAGVQRFVADLNRLYRDTPQLWSRDTEPGGFGWIEPDDASSNVYSFLRYDSHGAPVACVANLSGVAHQEYRIGLPAAGRWVELLNSDATPYGGSGAGNLGGVTATDEPLHGLPASAALHLPALCTIWLRPAQP
ncbi:MAG: 1,4-alpha-glucan branching protein GlgB [Micromonosporaceae bacterium]